MTKPPDRPKIYHITHVDNLGAIVVEGGLVCDREMLARGGQARSIGMSGIKRRRVEELDVHCHPGTKVGDYVPFYFCPRSVMLFVIHRANHPELTYRGGQGPIVHLEGDLYGVIRWAEANGRPWAFSLSNAGAYYTEFRSRTDELEQLDWTAIAAREFRAAQVKERKQAEFLVYERFPFDLVERIGVQSVGMHARAAAAIARADPRPAIEVRPDWYF
jgi:hypothetical protein